jgi:RNA 3'-terminal phosphate cyclase (ATP)
MGATLDLAMERPGFFPAGGGRLHARLTPGRLEPMELMSRGGDVTLSFEAIVSGISASIANRELFVLARELGTDRGAGRIVDVKDPRGPGNAVWARLDFPNGAEVVSAVGEKGVRAEVVARGVVNEVRALLAHDVPVGEHTADQLLLLCALAGGGRYRTVAPSLHTTTNADVIRRFLPVDIRFVDDGATWVVEVGPTG